MLFYCIEQCQEIQTIGQDPYSATQIINIAIWILMQLGIFPMKEFKTWVAVPNKTYPLLKTFIHEACMRCLTAITLGNKAGQLDYVANQNMFNMFHDKNPDKQSTDDNATTVTQTVAAATTGTSTLGSTYAAMPSAAIPPEVTMEMKQLSANQTVIMQQRVVMSFSFPPGLTQHCTCATYSQCSNPNAADRWVSTGTWWETGQYSWRQGMWTQLRTWWETAYPICKSLAQCRWHATLSWLDVPPRGWHSPVNRSLGNSWRMCAGAAQMSP
jgi:hypothetical protein